MCLCSFSSANLDSVLASARFRGMGNVTGNIQYQYSHSFAICVEDGQYDDAVRLLKSMDPTDALIEVAIAMRQFDVDRNDRGRDAFIKALAALR